MSDKKFYLGINVESVLILIGAALVLHGVWLDANGKANAWRQQCLGTAIMLAGWKGNTAWVDHVLEDAARTYLRLNAREESKAIWQKSTEENSSKESGQQPGEESVGESGEKNL